MPPQPESYPPPRPPAPATPAIRRSRTQAPPAKSDRLRRRTPEDPSATSRPRCSVPRTGRCSPTTMATPIGPIGPIGLTGVMGPTRGTPSLPTAPAQPDADVPNAPDAPAQPDTDGPDTLVADAEAAVDAAPDTESPDTESPNATNGATAQGPGLWAAVDLEPIPEGATTASSSPAAISGTLLMPRTSGIAETSRGGTCSRVWQRSGS